MAVFGAVVGAIAAVAGITAAILYYRQLQQMAATAREQSAATQGQNLLHVVAALQAEPVRESRHEIINLYRKGLALDLADERMRDHASRVCQAFSSAGFYARHGMIPEDLLIEEFGSLITRCHEVVEPWIATRRNMDARPDLWANYDWLADTVRAKHPHLRQATDQAGPAVFALVSDSRADERGESFSLPDEVINFIGTPTDVHVTTVRPTKIRGNHFHPTHREALVIFYQDAWSLHWDNGEGSQPAHNYYEGSGVVAFTAPPGTAHAVRNDGAKDLWIAGYSGSGYTGSAAQLSRRKVTD